MVNSLAAFNPSFIDRPWLAVYASQVSAIHDHVYVALPRFLTSQINVAASTTAGSSSDHPWTYLLPMAWPFLTPSVDRLSIPLGTVVQKELRKAMPL